MLKIGLFLAQKWFDEQRDFLGQLKYLFEPHLQQITRKTLKLIQNHLKSYDSHVMHNMVVGNFSAKIHYGFSSECWKKF